MGVALFIVSEALFFKDPRLCVEIDAVVKALEKLFCLCEFT